MVKQKSFNFTKKDLDALEAPKDKFFETYCDTTEKGLKLYVTKAGRKTFFIRKFVGYRDERIIIGPYPDLTISQARDKAKMLKGEIANGINPVEEKRKLRHDITLDDYYKYYRENYSVSNKRPRTIEHDDYIFKSKIHPFIGYKKMSSVIRQDIERIISYIDRAGMRTTANNTLKLIKTMYHRAIEWGYPGKNPTDGIKNFRLKSRERFILPDELQPFFSALFEDPDILFRNYILLSLYTGQRRSNVLSMRWSEIDFKLGVWFIPMTKNGESMDCPLTMKALALLSEMKQTATSEWVFPSKTSACGHLVEPKRHWQALLKRAGIENLRIHDLRRTLGSYQAINGSSLQIIGKSLGHKSIQSTQVYARLLNAPVLQSTNGAIDRMLSYVGGNI